MWKAFLIFRPYNKDYIKKADALLFADVFDDIAHHALEGGILGHPALHLLDGVDDGGVIPGAELLSLIHI